MKDHIDSQAKKDALLAKVLAMPIDGSYEGGITKLAQTRTAKQNRALHKYCSLLAETLNDGGYTVQVILAKAFGREWNMEAVKSLLWKPLQKLIIDKESTADADRVEYTKVYEQVNRHLGEIFGVPSVPWPVDKKKRRIADGN
jgi:hypothetical protein